MRSIRFAATGGIALFVLYVLGGVQHAVSPAAGTPMLAALQTAGAPSKGGVIIMDPTRTAGSEFGTPAKGGVIIIDLPRTAGSEFGTPAKGGVIIIDLPQVAA